VRTRIPSSNPGRLRQFFHALQYLQIETDRIRIHCIFLDSVSEANFITQAAHNRLGLKRSRISEIVSGLNEVESKVHNACEVHIKSKHSNFEINAQCLIIPKITKNLPSMKIDRSKLQLPSNIELADTDFYKVGPIDMLIGAEYFFDSLEVGKTELCSDQLVLQNTKLG